VRLAFSTSQTGNISRSASLIAKFAYTAIDKSVKFKDFVNEDAGPGPGLSPSKADSSDEDDKFRGKINAAGIRSKFIATDEHPLERKKKKTPEDIYGIKKQSCEVPDPNDPPGPEGA